MLLLFQLSNMHRFKSTNALHAAQEEEKEKNLRRRAKSMPKPIMAQGWRNHVDSPKSCNNFNISHDNETDSIEEGSSEDKSIEHVPKTPNNHEGIHSIL